MTKPTFDLHLIQSATQRANDYARDTADRVHRLLENDEDRERRIVDCCCKWCWYRRATVAAGQMITPYTCWRCDREYAHSNTAGPRLCRDCARDTDLCVYCCGDVNGRQRSDMTIPTKGNNK